MAGPYALATVLYEAHHRARDALIGPYWIKNGLDSERI
jgi:hypothetical protein